MSVVAVVTYTQCCFVHTGWSWSMASGRKYRGMCRVNGKWSKYPVPPHALYSPGPGVSSVCAHPL